MNEWKLMELGRRLEAEAEKLRECEQRARAMSARLDGEPYHDLEALMDYAWTHNRASLVRFVTQVQQHVHHGHVHTRPTMTSSTPSHPPFLAHGP